MSFKSDMAKVAAVATSMAPAAAFATEGTNEILGIDTFIDLNTMKNTWKGVVNHYFFQPNALQTWRQKMQTLHHR